VGGRSRWRPGGFARLQAIPGERAYLEGARAPRGPPVPTLTAAHSHAAAPAPQVWHNYAFDRHVFDNAGIKARGFGGDTMHMARLWNSSRTGKGYSLESLTKDAEVMKDALDIEGAEEELLRSKQSMRELFAKPNVRKDGTDGKLVRAERTGS
jgi:hypothetical protein